MSIFIQVIQFRMAALSEPTTAHAWRLCSALCPRRLHLARSCLIELYRASAIYARLVSNPGWPM